MQFMKILTGFPGPQGAQTLVGDIGLLILRLWAGGMMAIMHGLPKAGKLGEDPIKFRDPIGIGPELSLYGAVFTELVGAILLVLGLFTRLSLIGLVFTFAVIIFLVKLGTPYGEGLNYALAFFVVYIALLMTGPGRLSLDYLIWGKKENELIDPVS